MVKPGIAHECISLGSFVDSLGREAMIRDVEVRGYIDGKRGKASNTYQFKASFDETSRGTPLIYAGQEVSVDHEDKARFDDDTVISEGLDQVKAELRSDARYAGSEMPIRGRVLTVKQNPKGKNN
jgi:hypothetical protein